MRTAAGGREEATDGESRVGQTWSLGGGAWSRIEGSSRHDHRWGRNLEDDVNITHSAAKAWAQKPDADCCCCNGCWYDCMLGGALVRGDAVAVWE